MDEDTTLPLHRLERALIRGRGVGSRGVDSRAVASGRLDLERARGLPHLDEAVDALLEGGPRDRLGVVAGRPGDHAAPALLLAQRHDAVQRAPRFERSRLLEELGLELDAEGRIGMRTQHRGAENPPAEALARALDILSRNRHAGSVSRATTFGTRRRTV